MEKLVRLKQLGPPGQAIVHAGSSEPAARPGAGGGTILILCGFAYALGDSLLSYLANPVLGKLPTNALLPAIAGAILVIGRPRSNSMPILTALVITLGVVGLSVGAIQSADPLRSMAWLAGACSALIIGYHAATVAPITKSFVWVVIGVCGTYAVISAMAVMEIAPNLFPVRIKLIDRMGELVPRPEVMTDQNFHVFYMIPVAAVFAFPLSRLQGAVAALASLLNVFVLAHLQSRTGFLILTGTLVTSLAFAARFRGVPLRTVVVVSLTVCVTSILLLESLRHAANLMVGRFTVDQTETMYGRFLAAEYLLRKITDIGAWAPIGTAEFERLYGNVPHFNPTAFFLHGGILALACWVGCFLWPTMRIMGRAIFVRGLSPTALFAGLSGMGVIATQLTLHVPFFEQAWLWAGFTLGALHCLNNEHSPESTRGNDRRINQNPLPRMVSS